MLNVERVSVMNLENAIRGGPQPHEQLGQIGQPV